MPDAWALPILLAILTAFVVAWVYLVARAVLWPLLRAWRERRKRG